MDKENKFLNWFNEQDWRLKLFLGVFIFGMFLAVWTSITGNNNLTGNTIKEESNCNPNWGCSSWSECGASGIQKRVCTDYNNCNTDSGKPSEVQTCEYKIPQEVKQTETATTPENSSSSSLLDSLKELKEKLNEQSKINDKIDECTNLCSGEDINIPAVKNQCHSSCYQIYYYGGEESLDNYLSELKSGQN
jgi:hypothetical protein